MNSKLTNVLLVGVIVLMAFNLTAPQQATVLPLSPNVVNASFGARPAGATIVLANGDVASCPGGRIVRITFSSVKCVIGAASTRTPSPTALPSATATVSVPPTATHDMSVTVTPSAGLQTWEVWHTPGAHLLADGSMINIHSHGNKCQDWVNDWSQATFGHPVVYGGDENSGVMENSMKHQAYTEMPFSFNGVEYCLRFHASSTPMDRSSKVHSFEIYVRDLVGGITFNQGVYWSGDPAHQAQRMCHGDQFGGTTTYDGRPSVIRDQYVIISRCESEGTASDTWYVHFPLWDFGLTLLNATTFFHYDEYLDPMDMTKWKKTGANELTVRLEITSLPNPRVSVPFAIPYNRWWCIEHNPTISTRSFDGRALPFAYWDMTGAVANQNACPAGYLPQYNASTMPPVYFETGNDIERIYFPGADIIEFPN